MARRRNTPRKTPFYQKGWFIVLLSLFFMGVLALSLVFLYPKQTLGTVAKYIANGPAPNTEAIIEGDMPGISTLQDKEGNTITNFYTQRREVVDANDISPIMKNAIVAIEDRRFYEHEGVDWKGVMRAAITNATTDDVQGASTLTQQYIKNYTWLITSENEDEQANAIEQSYARKIAEIATAEDISEILPKDEILSRYLNLVSFGRNSFGVQNAARTFFGTTAKDLTIPQAALLAGLVQSPSYLDPYENPEGALERRNVVIQAMVEQGYVTPEEATNAQNEPLGVLETPVGLPQGCASAGNRGFFCDKVLEDLAKQDIDENMLNQGGYKIATTLDPHAQDVATEAAKRNAPDPAQPVAETVVLVQPGENTRFVRAIATSKDYGFEPGQTSLPLATSLVGHGAGSVFKVFAAAVALENGMGLQANLPVPATYAASGLGNGGQQGCPEGKYCVSNAGVYPANMTLTQALATSPNTPFIAIAEKVGNSAIVDKAVKMGLRSYAEGNPGETVADKMRPSGSFVLGPTAVNTLELANVGATIASNGVWCEPQTIAQVVHNGEDIQIPATSCERALEPDVAHLLAHGLSQDTIRGTAAQSARDTGWNTLPVSAKTGTTDANQSASFLAFTNGLAGAVYAFNDGDSAAPLCSAPLRQCDTGDLFGGKEPARTWFEAVKPLLDVYNGAELPAVNKEKLVSNSQINDKVKEIAVGKSEGDAVRLLRDAGFEVTTVVKVDNTDFPRGQVVDAVLLEGSLQGGKAEISVTYTGIESRPTETRSSEPDRARGRGRGNLPQPTTPARNMPRSRNLPAPLTTVSAY